MYMLKNRKEISVKAIRIDPSDRTVTAVEYPDGYQSIMKAVGQDNHNTFCLAGYFRKDTVYVNDDGLYIFDTFFELEGCGQGLFVGPGLIVGTEIGETDKTRPPKSTVEEVTSKIKWHDRVSALYRSKELGI
jgi:hypothetical protein